MTVAATAARHAVSSFGLAALVVSAVLVGHLIANPAPVVEAEGCDFLVFSTSYPYPIEEEACAAGPTRHRLAFGEISVIGTYEYEAACERITAAQDAFERCLAVAPNAVVIPRDAAPTRAQAIEQPRGATVGGLRDGGRVTIYARVVGGEVAEASALGTDLAVARCMADVVAEIGFARSLDTSLMIPVEITASYLNGLPASSVRVIAE